MGTPVVGPVIASAMVAAIGHRSAFCKGRDFAAWLGLVPKQISTGSRTILGSISRRGNRYLRTLFIQGARSILFRSGSWAKYGLARWLASAVQRLQSAGCSSCQQARENRLGGPSSGQPIRTKLYCTGRINSHQKKDPPEVRETECREWTRSHGATETW